MGTPPTTLDPSAAARPASAAKPKSVRPRKARGKVTLPPLSPAKDPADYPFFTGGVSRTVWRIYTQRLTPAGRWFALVSAGFVSYAGASLQLQGYVLASYVGVLWLVAVAAMLLYRPKVKLDVQMADRVCAGETLPADLRITQLSRWRGADLTVIPHRLPMAVDAVADHGTALPDLKKGESAAVRVGLRCQKRGLYTVRGFRVDTSFPFGVLRARQVFYKERKLLVYPKFSPLARLALPTGRRYQPGGVALASELGESFEYLGNRDYREGDNIRDIDWRATARLQRPVVREWVEEYMLRVAVILDTHVPADLSSKAADARRDDFERAVSVAAGVSDYMARQDYLVDLFAAGPNLYHLTAGRSLAYLDQILDILACVDENPDEPFGVIEPQIAELLARISTVICVFLDWDAPRQAFCHRLAAGGVAVKVILANNGRPTLDPSADIGAFGPVPVVGKQEFDRGIDEL